MLNTERFNQEFLKNYLNKNDGNEKICLSNKLENYEYLFSKGFNHKNTPEFINNYMKFINNIVNWDRNSLIETLKKTNGLVDVLNIFDLEINLPYKACHKTLVPPTIYSNEMVLEFLELYAMSYARDIHFDNYETNEIIKQCIYCLNLINNSHTEYTLFRGETVGDKIGPYISQFLIKPFMFGAMPMNCKYQVYKEDVNYMTTVNQFLQIWDGLQPTQKIQLGPIRYLSTLRDLASYIHKDPPYQPFFNACLIIQQMNVPYSFISDRQNQKSFVSLGAIDIFDLMMRATKLSMDTSWLRKWTLLRLRPEEAGYQLELNPNLFPTSLINNPIIKLANPNNSLLPQAYAEGSPLHPSFPAGHATIASACCTILKAFYDNDFVITNPLVVSNNGSSLDPYTLTPLTLSNELDKLVSNCALGRNSAGIHYRSDGDFGILIGEEIALHLLNEMVHKYVGNVTFQLKLRNGTLYKITNS